MNGLPRVLGSRCLAVVIAILVGALVAAPAATASPVVAPVSASTAFQGGAATASSSWTFSGLGFGHGVGTSQYGARAMADRGRTAQQILAFYYRGTTYDAVPDNRSA